MEAAVLQARVYSNLSFSIFNKNHLQNNKETFVLANPVIVLRFTQFNVFLFKAFPKL